MRNIKFRINNQLADYYNQSDLAPRIYKRVFDVEQIDFKGGDYTLNLKLPKTKNNNKIFNFLGEIQNGLTFNTLRRFNAEIELDGDIIISGSLSVDRIFKDYYQCTIIGENISFAEILDQLSLRDIKTFNKILFSGARSTAYSPFNNQYPNSIGVRDIQMDAFGNSYDEDEFEFCLPLINYGNFPAPASYAFSNRSASENEFHFYNTSTEYLPPTAFFPSPYIRPIIKNIFKDQGYNVAGDFFEKDEYKNIFLPYTSADAEPQNYGLLGRIDIDRVTNTNGTPNYRNAIGNNANCRFIKSSASPFPNTLEAEFEVSDAGLSRIVYYIKPTITLGLDSITGTEFIGENYLYEQTYFNLNPPLDEPNYQAYNAPTSGYYNIKFTCEGFGAKRANLNNTPGLQNKWNTNLPHNSAQPQQQGFYFLLVKRILNNPDDINGDNDNGWVDIKSLSYPLELDPVVVYSQFFDVSTGAYNSLSTTSIDVTLEVNDVYLERNETVELQLAFTYDNYLPNFLPVNSQNFSIDDNSNQKIEVIPQLDVELNPALQLPDITQAEFLKSIINTYNLYLFYDSSSNTVILNNYDNYFLPNSTAIDQSDKANIEDDSIIIEPVLKYNIINFKLTDDDNDKLLWFDDVPINLHLNTSNDYYTQVKDIEVGHSYTSMRNFFMVNEIGIKDSYTMYLPTLCNDEVYNATLLELYDGDAIIDNDFNQRLLKYTGIKKLNDFTKNLQVGDIGFNLGGSFFYPSSFNFILNEFNPTFQREGNLYNNYQNKYINVLKDSFLISLNAFLLSSDLSNFDIRRPIKIGNQLYIVNAINEFNPIEETTTQIKLYKK